MGFNGQWQGDMVLQDFQCWWTGHFLLRAVPCIIAWGIWITRNRYIFHDSHIPMEAVVAQIAAIIQHFRAPEQIPKIRRVREELIDKDIPWGYFDGASQAHQLNCGGGGVLYKSEDHFFHFSAGLGRGSNNYAELMTLRLLLLFTLEQGCLSLQVFGDSMLVIEWEKENVQCHVMILIPILEEVIHLKQQFNHISFTHVYRERNRVADQLSKEATLWHMDLGIWRITTYSHEGSYSYYHRPFHETALEQF